MYLVSGYQPQRRPETAPSRNTEPKILTCRYKSQNYFNASACTVCMYVCMYVCFCHLHWCAPATASHSCRLWGPTTSLTHPLHTYIPHIYKDKFHKCKCLLFYVCMYITSCSGDSLLRGREDGVIHRSRVRNLEPAHVEPFHSSLSSDGTQKRISMHSFIHTYIQYFCLPCIA